MHFYLAKERVSLKRSFQLYWLYVLPFILLPFIAIAIRAAFAPNISSIVFSACFVVVAVLALWPVAFRDAANKLWLFACMAWFISAILAMFVSAVLGVGAA
jgi:uncharacterized membrane protein